MLAEFTTTTEAMQGPFKDILGIQGVKGIMLFNRDGKLVIKHFLQPYGFDPEVRDWWSLYIYTLDGIKEAELVFERDRLYIRRAKQGYLFVLASNAAPAAMIRLNCEILLSIDSDAGSQKGLARFFREKTDRAKSR